MAYPILDSIQTPENLRKISPDALPQLASELREFIIDVISSREGHLGASLGVVELTIALHYVFNTPDDRLIWDVGHQAYGHKILTGRKDKFETIRQSAGISGFPKRSESSYDAFGTGHSSTSISAALGMAIASKLQGNDERDHIAVIGDASLAAGMAFEGMNHAGVTDANLLIVLNDNAIGIDPSVGALKDYLTSVKEGRNPRENNMAKSLNFDYSGPVDGHDLPALIREFRRLKNKKGPRFLHVITTKGKGMHLAEADQVKYHAPGKFDRATGEILKSDESHLPPKFQDVFGKTLLDLAQKNEKIIGITPAMPSGSSMKFMIEAIPERAFDVGIAEQHAVTLSAGMACEGFTVFCNIYSTFLQRAYDQVIHDVVLQKLPVVFCLDRSGLVGQDGPTHHGVFDIAYLRCIPDLILYAPMDERDLRNILFTAQLGLEKPIAIRYPRGRGVLIDWETPYEKLAIGKARKLKDGSEVAVLSTGFIGNEVKKALSEINDPDRFAHYDFGFVKPLDASVLDDIFNRYKTVITVEEGTVNGGFGSAVSEFASEKYPGVSIKILGIPDAFIEHGTPSELLEICKLDNKNLRIIFEES